MQPGQRITEALQLVRPLGQGGMGSVWVANHLALGIQVAVKFMSPALVCDQASVERFRREAMAAAQIKSPHVAQVFDHGVTADRLPYIAMELLEGELLSKRVRRLGPLNPRDVATVVTQVAKALARAHQLRIVHRDIKPDNIFVVDMEGEIFVKVIDFGVAKQSSETAMEMTSTGSMIGTPLYMSPEQLFSGKHVDFRSDLWSLAVVAYHAFTGRIPFTGETLGSLSVAVHTGVFSMPSTMQPGIPPPVDGWFQRALQRNPADRFPSAKEMAEALERAVGAPWTAWSSTSMPVIPAPAPSGSGMEAATPWPAGSGVRPAETGSFPNVAQTSAPSAQPREGSTRRVSPWVLALAAIGVAGLGGGGAFFVFGGQPVPAPAASVEAPAASAPGSELTAPVTAARPPETAAAPFQGAPAAPTSSAASSSTSVALTSPPASGGGAIRRTPPPTGATPPPRSIPKDTIGF